MDKHQEIDLVKRAQAGDKQAFRQLYEHYHPRIFNLAYQIMRKTEDAEEVVQESFVKAYLGIANFKGDSSFYTWLYRITRNMAIDVRRRMQRHVQVLPETNTLEQYASEEQIQSSAGESPERKLINKEELGLLSRALSSLSEEHRNMILMREVEGFSYQEIAKISGLTSGTVMSRLFYARKALQKALGVV